MPDCHLRYRHPSPAQYIIGFVFCLCCLILLCHLPVACANEEMPSAIEFNSEFLVKPESGNSVNISRFSESNVALAGVYSSDVYVNERWAGKTDLVLRDIHGADHSAVVCIDRPLLDMLNVDFSKIAPDALEQLMAGTTGQCVQLEDILPDATVEFDAGQLRRQAQIPQIALNRNARGYMHPRFWDRGVTAATIGYNFNAYRMQHAGVASTSYFLGLNNGLNLGDWHLRHYGSFTKNDQGFGKYQNAATFLQRDIVGLHSQLIIGDAYTVGQLFDSIGFKGVRIASDDRMLPDSQVGYAPVVRGIAHSNAKVRITQNGVLLYEMTVAPGAFEINDLYATGYGGDLTVTITEASGDIRTFTVPFVSFAPLLREGATRYSLTAGQTRQASAGRPTPFVEAVAGYGLSNNVTLNGGLLLAKQYLAGAVGAAVNTPLGAISFDVIHAKTQFDDGRHQQGSSVQLKYSKVVEQTNTVFSLSAYRYSGKAYFSFQEAQANSDAVHADDDAAGHARHRLQLTLNQPLGESGGAFFFSGSMQRYWGTNGRDVQYAVGYSNAIGRMAYTVSMQRQQSVLRQQADHQFYVSLSMPLGIEMNSPNMMLSHNHNETGGASMATVNGTLGKQGGMSYSVSAARSGKSLQGSANGQYRHSYAVMNGTYSYGRLMQQMSASVSGGVVIHPKGITLSQTLGESIGVIEAKDAAGAQVNTSGVYIDSFGHAIVPSLTPYRVNQVDIDPKGLSMDVELLTSNQRVTPHAGAVVMLTYPTNTSRALLIDATHPDGSTPPFGAEVVDAEGNYLGMAGQGGRIFVRGLEGLQGVLTVRWGKEPDQRCTLPYHFSADKTHQQSLEKIDSVCVPVATETMPETPDEVAIDNVVSVQ
jgi:outer membrane usher protein